MPYKLIYNTYGWHMQHLKIQCVLSMASLRPEDVVLIFQ